MENGGHQMTMLDVHVLEAIALLLSVELVKEGLLEVDALDVEDLNKTLVVALVT
jgi:hypothetical protein